MTESKTESQPTYAPSYKVIDHCLLETKNSKQGPYDKKLCNFMPWITSEVTLDDGAQTTTRIRLKGIHQSGRELPEIEIPADELGNFNWVAKHWGINCILEVGQNVKDSLRYAIQTSAESADHQTVYAVTGWKKINGVWEFLMPGADDLTVHLPGKMQGYRMEQEYDYLDVQVVSCLMQDSFAPDEILLPLLAFTFLTPLNHFLKLAGCEPKFVLFLVGKTGSRKSTLAALFLSFFGRFTGTELPLSFRDTANSILHNAFTLKDVLTCIDDFHPAGRQEEQKLTATAQSIMRAYGDRTGKGRLRADSTPMDARPPQGNAIITAEFPPDIGESGTARYFALELKNGDIDLEYLTSIQREAEKGTLRRCMFAYIQWLKELFLVSDDTQKEFVSLLKGMFETRRNDFRESGIQCHGRVPEAVAHLQIGMDMFLFFLKDNGNIPEDYMKYIAKHFKEILYDLARKQADSIVQDKPTHKFIRKLYALIESNQCSLLPRNQIHDFVPSNCIGYEDETLLYLNCDLAHRAVKKLCEDQGEAFTISCKSLLKQLAEEELIFTSAGQNTRSVRINGKSKRLLCLYREKAQLIADGVL